VNPIILTIDVEVIIDKGVELRCITIPSKVLNFPLYIIPLIHCEKTVGINITDVEAFCQSPIGKIINVP